MNPKEFVYNTAHSVQLPYIAGHFLLNVRSIEIMCTGPLMAVVMIIYKHHEYKIQE